jgi:hypothetical protein
MVTIILSKKIKTYFEGPVRLMEWPKPCIDIIPTSNGLVFLMNNEC